MHGPAHHDTQASNTTADGARCTGQAGMHSRSADTSEGALRPSPHPPPSSADPTAARPATQIAQSKGGRIGEPDEEAASHHWKAEKKSQEQDAEEGAGPKKMPGTVHSLMPVAVYSGLGGGKGSILLRVHHGHTGGYSLLGMGVGVTPV